MSLGPSTVIAIRQRLGELNIWDPVKCGPIFGWTPLLEGWFIVIAYDTTGTRACILLNNVEWTYDFGCAWRTRDTPFHARAHLYRPPAQ